VSSDPWGNSIPSLSSHSLNSADKGLMMVAFIVMGWKVLYQEENWQAKTSSRVKGGNSSFSSVTAAGGIKQDVMVVC
jgi:hypothetical protein